MDENNSSIIAVVADLVAAYVQRISDLIQLATLEAQLAIRTLVIISILIFISGAVLTVTWISILVCVFFYLISLHFSTLTASLIIAAINIGVMTIIYLTIYRIKNNLFFPSTRKQLNQFENTPEEIKNEQATAEN